MNKVFTLICLGLLSYRPVQAQVTPEKVYRGYGEMLRLSTGDYKYQLVRSGANQITLYNLNHSLYKQIAVPSLGASYELGGIQYVSDALFDTNPANIEYIATYNSTNSTGGLRRAVVYSETGNQLAVLDSANYYVSIYNTPAGTKMLSTIRTYDNAYTLTREYTRVYNLAGHLALRVATPELADAAGAYPNPAHAVVNLPYSVGANETGTLRVYTTTGQLAATYRIDGHVSHLEMSTRDLRPGVYTYQVETATGRAAGKRFVIE